MQSPLRLTNRRNVTCWKEWLDGQTGSIRSPNVLFLGCLRYNLSRQPEAFAENEIVRTALRGDDKDCLPLILIDGCVVSRGRYPAREELASLCGVASAQRVCSGFSGISRVRRHAAIG